MTGALEKNALPALLRDYFAPAAELLVAALVPPPTAHTVLVSHCTPVLATLFKSRHPHARYVVMDESPPPALKGMGLLKPAVAPLHGNSIPLPFRPACAGAVVHGLVMSPEAGDGPLLRETVRLLVPNGVYAGAFLLRGSFDTFFSAARHLPAVDGFPNFRPFLDNREAQFRLPDALENLAARAGLTELSLGVQEQALMFDSVDAFMDHPAVGTVLFRGLDAEAKDGLRRGMHHELDTQPLPLTMRLVLGVLRGVRS